MSMIVLFSFIAVFSWKPNSGLGFLGNLSMLLLKIFPIKKCYC